MPDLSAMGGDVCHIGDDGRDAIPVSLNGVVHLLPGPGPLSLRILIDEFRGIHLPHFLKRRVVCSPCPVGRTTERVIHDKRLDDGIECLDVRQRLFQVMEGALCSGFLVEMGHGISHRVLGCPQVFRAVSAYTVPE